jgi:hypothetical protein
MPYTFLVLLSCFARVFFSRCFIIFAKSCTDSVTHFHFRLFFFCSFAVCAQSRMPFSAGVMSWPYSFERVLSDAKRTAEREAAVEPFFQAIAAGDVSRVSAVATTLSKRTDSEDDELNFCFASQVCRVCVCVRLCASLSLSVSYLVLCPIFGIRTVNLR